MWSFARWNNQGWDYISQSRQWEVDFWSFLKPFTLQQTHSCATACSHNSHTTVNYLQHTIIITKNPMHHSYNPLKKHIGFYVSDTILHAQKFCNIINISLLAAKTSHFKWNICQHTQHMLCHYGSQVWVQHECGFGKPSAFPSSMRDIQCLGGTRQRGTGRDCMTTS